MRERPAFLTVTSIIGIIWAALALLTILWGLTVFFLQIGPPNPKLDALKHETGYLVMVFGGGCVNTLLNFVLLVGSIGALKLKRWSRPALIAYAWTDLALGFIIGAYNLVYIVPRVFDAVIAASHPRGVATPPGFDVMMRVLMYVGGAMGIVIALVMPILILTVMSRQNVRDAYAPE